MKTLKIEYLQKFPRYVTKRSQWKWKVRDWTMIFPQLPMCSQGLFRSIKDIMHLSWRRVADEALFGFYERLLNRGIPLISFSSRVCHSVISIISTQEDKTKVRLLWQQRSCFMALNSKKWNFMLMHCTWSTVHNSLARDAGKGQYTFQPQRPLYYHPYLNQPCPSRNLPLVKAIYLL